MKETASNSHSVQARIQMIGATIRLLYQANRQAFLIGTLTGVIEALFYPLLLFIGWQGFSLVLADAGRGNALIRQGIMLLAALFAVLAVQYLLRLLNETAESILKAESSQQINELLMSKMSEIPYQFFEENSFQARYGLVITQGAFRPSMLVEALISSVSSLVSFLGIIVTLLALAPLLAVLLLALIPLAAVESRFRSRTVEFQTVSAPDLFRMQYLSQKSIDATWQQDIRIHHSSILHEEHHLLGRRYLRTLKRLLHRFQALRLGSV